MNLISIDSTELIYQLIHWEAHSSLPVKIIKQLLLNHYGNDGKFMTSYRELCLERSSCFSNSGVRFVISREIRESTDVFSPEAFPKMSALIRRRVSRTVDKGRAMNSICSLSGINVDSTGRAFPYAPSYDAIRKSFANIRNKYVDDERR